MVCIGQLIWFIIQLTWSSCKFDQYSTSVLFMQFLQKGNMYFKFSLSPVISESCSLIFRFMRGVFCGTTLVIRLISHAGIDRKDCFSHLGRPNSPDKVLRLKDYLFRRQKKPPMASRQQRFQEIYFIFASWEKSTPLMQSISFRTQSSTKQEGTQLRKQKEPRKEARKRHRYIALSVSLDSLSFFILSTFSLNLREKNSSFSDWKLNVVSVKWTIKASLSCFSCSPMEQKKIPRLRRLYIMGVYDGYVNFTLSLPQRMTSPQIYQQPRPDLPRFFITALDGTPQGGSIRSSSNATSFQPELVAKRLESYGKRLGSKMRDFMSQRNQILCDISTSWYLYLFLEDTSLTSCSQLHSFFCSELRYLPSIICSISPPRAEYQFSSFWLFCIQIIYNKLLQIK